MSYNEIMKQIIYYTTSVIVFILCAGDKSTQKKDIQKAKDIIKEIKE